MFYALTHGKVGVEGVEVTPVLEEIEALNRRALAGELEVTAISAAAYPQVAGRYRILDAGAAMGEGSGPILVARSPIPREELPERVVAVPGQFTTAALLLRLYLGEDVPTIIVSFEKIPKVVLEGQADVGLLIHEGQITYEALGLTKVLDLGERWFQESRLPLPLGINVVRRDLGDDLGGKLSNQGHGTEQLAGAGLMGGHPHRWRGREDLLIAQAMDRARRGASLDPNPLTLTG